MESLRSSLEEVGERRLSLSWAFGDRRPEDKEWLPLRGSSSPVSLRRWSGEREDFLEEPEDLWGSFEVLPPEE